MGFLPTGKMQGPTPLVFKRNYHNKKTKLVVPMKDDAGNSLSCNDIVFFSENVSK
ncbi:hypothetical protein N898_03015 [Salmonella enterica subsp. arizonae serovar 62:z36:- str. RKS2983]|nr:hypothetical protein N898_03015 [Salmonella enterica subsp. arizonae serovar 62:z36:- str. RKS2983]